MHPRAEEFTGRAREQFDFEPPVEEFPEGTKTAADAAEAIGCELGQIASSLVFVGGDDPVVVVTSGANRVSEAKLAEVLGVSAGDVRTANPDEVRAATGWAIGGVPPFCHDDDPPVYVDRTLATFERVWAAAGTPEAVFAIDPDRLVELSGGEVVDVAE